MVAIAVFSFSMLTIVGLLGTGLTSAEGSSRNLAMANIERFERANLEATAYTNLVGTPSVTNYFTDAGCPTVLNPVSSSDNPYYSVSYTTNSLVNSLTSSGAAKIIQTSVVYPYPANAYTNTFCFFIAQ